MLLNSLYNFDGVPTVGKWQVYYNYNSSILTFTSVFPLKLFYSHLKLNIYVVYIYEKILAICTIQLKLYTYIFY